MSNEQVLTVGALSSYIEQKFVRDPYLERVFIKGEISNSKLHNHGHFYFTLKDESATIRGIMFSSKTKTLKMLPKDGDSVIIEGAIRTYKVGGYYQITASGIQLDGQGQLFEKLEAHKKQLKSEGYFDEKYKRDIKKFPESIMLVTSITSAAHQDMLNAVKKRFPLTKVKVINTLMQGQYSVNSVLKNLEIADQSGVDTVILARGGGSIEDLWTFNELDVAKKVFNMNTPTITAIGHESDTTLVDYVSDRRATTPTQAIEIALIDQNNIKDYLREYQLNIKKVMRDMLYRHEQQLLNYKNYYKFRVPERLYEQHINLLSSKIDRLDHLFQSKLKYDLNQYDTLKRQLEYLTPRNDILTHQKDLKHHQKSLNDSIQSTIEQSKQKLAYSIESLEHLNPLEILKRGYSFTSLDGHVLKHARDVNVGDTLEITLSDGTVKTQVTEVKIDE